MATRPAKTPAEAVAEHAPWRPPSYEDHEAAALQALERGTATMAQQKMALNWIIFKAAGTYDLPYRPGGLEGERDTLFALGRMMVGQQIVKLLRIRLGAAKPK